MTNIEARLSKAKTQLILDHPFVGVVALNMKYELDKSIPTAATNGKRIKFNPDFVASLHDEELKFLVAHECMHPMLEHIFRRNGRNAKKWNIATDYVVNQLLIADKIGKMPPGGLLDHSIYTAGGGTSEGIYDILPASVEENAAALDDCEDAEGTPAEQSQLRADWQVITSQAAQAAKSVGKLSANMQRLVDKLLKPKVDWRTVLQNFLVKAKNDERSFARFNRRFVSQGLYLPSINGEMMGDVVVAVDCSGSIDQKILNQFAAEITAIKDDLMPQAIHVLYFDSKITHVERYEPTDSLNLMPRGGGGTDFAPVFKKIQELNIEPVAIVFLTDLECDSFGEKPEAPVLWVTTAPGKAPFGEVVEIKE